MSERGLLEKLIEKKLGKGIAHFEVEVGSEGKRIDLVFEREDEIWLIEAKKKLNFDALGQVLTYKKLYQKQFFPQKTLKLAIVCEEGDLEIEETAKGQGIKVFVFPEKEGEKMEELEESPICGVCGTRMIKEDGEWKCKICEYFFGMSSMVAECYQCKKMFGTYPAVENPVLNSILKTENNIRYHWRKGLCPACRREGYGYYGNKKIGHRPYGTLAELIRYELSKRDVTPIELQIQKIPREFIDYCLGKMMPFKGD